MGLDLLLSFSLQHSQRLYFWKQVNHFPDNDLKGILDQGEGRLYVVEMLSLLVLLFRSWLSLQTFFLKILCV